MSGADRFYSRWAWLYEFVALRTPGVRRLRREGAARLAPPAGGTVLDMGCATGPNFRYLRDAVGPDGRVVGFDVASGALRRARRSIDRAGWENVHVGRTDATRPPVTEADAVFAGFVLGMFEDPAGAVERWCDLVGEGGRIGLIDFTRSERWYAPLPNLALRAIIVVSAPGRTRFRWDAMQLLQRRVDAGHQVLEERCTDHEVTSHWGGIVEVHTATVEDAT